MMDLEIVMAFFCSPCVPEIDGTIGTLFMRPRIYGQARRRAMWSTGQVCVPEKPFLMSGGRVVSIAATVTNSIVLSKVDGVRHERNTCTTSKKVMRPKGGVKEDESVH